MRFEAAHDRALEMELAERLQERRVRLRLGEEPWTSQYTLKRVGEKVGVSKVAVFRWEESTACPMTLGLWQRWARALGGKLKIELELPDG